MAPFVEAFPSPYTSTVKTNCFRVFYKPCIFSLVWFLGTLLIFLIFFLVVNVQLYLRVKEDGFCTFPDGRLQPPPEAIAGGVGLVDGVNNVRFEIRWVEFKTRQKAV